MTSRTKTCTLLAALLLASTAPSSIGAAGKQPDQTDPAATRLIVQGTSVEHAAAAVAASGGEVTHRLKVIDAVGARLGPAELAALTRSANGIRLYADRVAETAKKGGNGNGGGNGKGQDNKIEKKGLDTAYAALIDADSLHQQGIDGRGVTIAFLDTGIWTEGSMIEDGIAQNGDGAERILAQYNAIEDLEATGSILEQLLAGAVGEDGSGHGTHVASVAVSSYKAKLKGNDKEFNGVAPNADLVIVKAFDGDGVGTYLDVIRGVDWVINNKDRFGIRVLNLSFSAEPRSHYWDDPLNQAVMEAWRAGIVVVASAGNRGPEAMTIGVPGNVPYVITVGAMSDAASNSPSDDYLTSFSSTGPTVEGFIKPELLAPGGHVMGLMAQTARIALEHPEYHDGASYFTMSGTSQAAAVISGVAALLLQYDPGLSPDDVKCRLMATARPATTEGENKELILAYTVFQQGAGLVNARDAVYDLSSGCANRGLDVDAELAGELHFGGLANRDENGNYFLMGLEGDGFIWNDTFSWSDGFKFHQGYAWSDGFIWNDGFVWSDDYTWSDGFLWNDGFFWNDGLTGTMSINTWVEQE